MTTIQISPDWLNLPHEARMHAYLHRGGRLRTPSPMLILNASPDAEFREDRSKVLNGTGYYTCSARTSADIVRLAAQMKCAAAVVCHSFSSGERRAVAEQLRKISPETKIVLLEDASAGDPQTLLARLKEAFSPTIAELPEAGAFYPAQT